jgi:hypothetical protein
VWSDERRGRAVAREVIQPPVAAVSRGSRGGRGPHGAQR